MKTLARKLVDVIRNELGGLAMLLAVAGWFWFTVSWALDPATRTVTVLALCGVWLAVWLAAVLMKD